MTTTLTMPPRSSLRLGSLGDDPVTQTLVTGMTLAMATFLILIPAWLTDTRMLDNAAIWTKPQKFNLSLALHFATLAVLAQLLPTAVRSGRAMSIATYLMSGAFVLETLYIITQAARGTRSHFNFGTPFESALYAAMGIGAVLIIGAALVLAIQIARKGDRTRRGLWLGSVVGLSVGFFATLFFTSYLSEGRFVGAPLEGGGATLPLLGWSLEHGDLRPSHFVSLHIMQLVPFAGWLADKRGWNPLLVVLTSTALLLALASALLVQALAGQPIWPL